MALAAGADYIAPYVNRIGNLGADPFELIDQLQTRKCVNNFNLFKVNVISLKDFI